MTWKIPENVKFPPYWYRFEGNILEDNGKPLTYTIESVTEDLHEAIVDHMCRYFMIREVMISHDALYEDEESRNELRNVWTKMLKQGMSLVALVEGCNPPTERIAGCNILAVSQKSDPKIKFRGRTMDHLICSMDEIYRLGNAYERYKTDKFLSAFGLSVSSRYAGDNVSYHLLKARIPLCQATGIPLSVTIFSSPAAIHVAEKNGHEIIVDVKSHDFKVDGKLAYPRLKSERIVLTAKVIPEVK